MGPVGLKAFATRMAKLAEERKDEKSQFLLQELQLYAESIAPYENEQLL